MYYLFRACLQITRSWSKLVRACQSSERSVRAHREALQPCELPAAHHRQAARPVRAVHSRRTYSDARQGSGKK